MKIGEIEAYKTRGGRIRWRLQYDADHIYGYDTEAVARIAQAELQQHGITLNPFIKNEYEYKGVLIQYTASGYYNIPGYASKDLDHIKIRIDTDGAKRVYDYTKDDIVYVDPEAVISEEESTGVNKGLSGIMLVIIAVIVVILVLLGVRK